MAEKISYQLEELIIACAKAIVKLDYVWINAQNQVKLGPSIGVDGLYHNILDNVMDLAMSDINFKLEDIPEKPSWVNLNLDRRYANYITYDHLKELRKKVKLELKHSNKPLKQQFMAGYVGGTLDKREVDKRIDAFRRYVPAQIQGHFEMFVEDLTKYLQQKA